jgi:hypothetical protein
VADLIERLLRRGPRVYGQPYQVFLLSAAGNQQTLRLPHPVKNTTTDHKGKTWAWTMGQRYTQSSVLLEGPKTTTELEQLGG